MSLFGEHEPTGAAFQRFHEERPDISEDLLARSLDQEPRPTTKLSVERSRIGRASTSRAAEAHWSRGYPAPMSATQLSRSEASGASTPSPLSSWPQMITFSFLCPLCPVANVRAGLQKLQLELLRHLGSV